MALEAKLLEQLTMEQKIDYNRLVNMCNQSLINIHIYSEGKFIYENKKTLENSQKLFRDTTLPKEIFYREIYRVVDNFSESKSLYIIDFAKDYFRSFKDGLEWYKKNGESYFEQFKENEVKKTKSK